MKHQINPPETTENLPDTANKPPVKNKGGRPRKTPQDALALQAMATYHKAVAYKESVGDALTITGLARHLGYADSRELIDTAQGGDRGARMALSLCEEMYEQLLKSGKYSAGAVCALKQIGWRDTQYIQQETKTVSVNVTLSASLADLSKALRPVMQDKPEETR